jgi:hypothetical protein
MGQTVRRLITIAVILVIGVVAYEWARHLLPNERVINSYSSYTINIQEGGSAGASPEESFTFGQRPGGTISISWKYQPEFGSTGSGSDQTLEVVNSLDFFGHHIKLIHCPQPDECSTLNGPSGREIVTTFESSSLLGQTETAVLKDPSLGFAYNSETAIAEMPYVSVESQPVASSTGSGTGSGAKSSIIANDIPVSVDFDYDLPGASAYDWSLPPLSVSSNQVMWGETVNPDIGPPAQRLTGDAQAVELTGSDHTAQATDNNHIFVSGVLFGIAGAAALTVVLEFLHLIFKIE